MQSYERQVGLTAACLFFSPNKLRLKKLFSCHSERSEAYATAAGGPESREYNQDGKKAHDGNFRLGWSALDTRFRGYDTGGKITGWILNDDVILQSGEELSPRTLQFAIGITGILEPILKAMPTFSGMTNTLRLKVEN